MKTCPQCGVSNADELDYCLNCGAKLGPAENSGYRAENDQPQVNGPWQQLAPDQGWQATQKAATKKEFLNLPENDKMRKEITTAAIICYICAGLTAVLGLIGTFAGGGVYFLLDVAILVGMGLGIQLAQSRVCAILLLVYSVFNTVMNLIFSSRLGGYLIVIAAIFAVIYTFKAEKAWKAYQSNTVNQ